VSLDLHERSGDAVESLKIPLFSGPAVFGFGLVVLAILVSSAVLG
jgi:hypothetical protein